MSSWQTGFTYLGIVFSSNVWWLTAESGKESDHLARKRAERAEERAED